MAQLNYGIPDDLHRALKILAAERRMTLKDLIIDLLTSDVVMAKESSDG